MLENLDEYMLYKIYQTTDISLCFATLHQLLVLLLVDSPNRTSHYLFSVLFGGRWDFDRWL